VGRTRGTGGNAGVAWFPGEQGSPKGSPVAVVHIPFPGSHFAYSDYFHIALFLRC
jgi:hypothetical protein